MLFMTSLICLFEAFAALNEHDAQDGVRDVEAHERAEREEDLREGMGQIADVDQREQAEADGADDFEGVEAFGGEVHIELIQHGKVLLDVRLFIGGDILRHHCTMR
jgi:hypothetical protein